MLHIRVIRVAGIPDSNSKVWFEDDLHGDCDEIGLFFDELELKEDGGARQLAHALTIQAQGWTKRPEGRPGISRLPVIRVVRVKVEPGGKRIEIRDGVTLTLRIDEDILTEIGARDFQQALRDRARCWLRTGCSVGYVSPERQHQLS
jgi:hypothetical protein